MGYIYKITNLINKKAYIGETLQADAERRWKTHTSLSKLNKGCPALKEALQKYGVKNFKFEILIICFDEDRLYYEKEYIKKYNSVVPNGYNISEGGFERGFSGLHHSKEAKAKISKAVKERYSDPEERAKASITLKQSMIEKNTIEKRKNGEAWKKAIAEDRIGKQNLGKKLSEETKQKISNKIKEYFKNTESKNINNYNDKFKAKVCKRVNQLSLDGSLIQTFESISDAVRATKTHRNNIHSVLRKKTNTAGGYKWEYADT